MINDIIIIVISLKQSLYPTLTHDPKRLKYKGPFNIDYRERRLCVPHSIPRTRELQG